MTAFTTPALAQDNPGIEDILVTSQRRAESIQDVPLAVTAFDAGAIDRFQIESPGDLQFTTPNISFSKANFTSTNFQIRGIGETLSAASSDAGVGVHVNDIPLVTPRLFETEFYDIERLEVLRGPQGTLFGRNATGGVVNMLTKRPTDEFEGYGELEYGNYDAVRVEGAVNAPLGDWGAVRFAGTYINRDGYTDNVFLGTSIDDRDIYSLRGSLRLYPSENTTIDIIASHFKEDDARVRSQKQLCDRDPSGVLGCLPTGLGFGTTNVNATLAGLVTSSAVLGDPAAGGLGLGLFGAEDINQAIPNPADLRQVAQDFDPQYEADETFVMIELQHEFEALTATVLGAYQETSVLSLADFNANATPVGTATSAAALANLAAIAPTTFAALFSDGQFPLSAVTSGGTGVIGGDVFDRSGDFARGYDQSFQSSEQWFIEARVNSSFDGPFNFLAGANYLEYDNQNQYAVVSASLDYFAAVRVPAEGFAALVDAAPTCGLPPAAGGGFGTPACASPTDGLGLVSPYFNADSAAYGLNALSLFGEAYYQVTERLKLTGGLRWTRDKKTIADRLLLFNNPVPIGTTDGDAAGALPAINGLRDTFGSPTSVTFTEFTGRFVADFQLTPDTLLYASFSRGYKSGGFNPPFDPQLFPSSAPTFEPEFINAFEIGAKNQFLDQRLQANFSAFYYDYAGLQTAKTINRTSFNENIDAQIWGAEAEFLFSPADGWLFNLSASYLDSSIGDTTSVDTRDPSGGRADSFIIKDLASASNCVVNGTNDPTLVQGTLAANPATAPLAGAYVAIPASSGLAFGLCDNILNGVFDDGGNQIAPDLATLTSGAFSGTDGNPVSLKGNELQNASNMSISVGGQYTHRFENGLSLTGRADYYWQGDFYTRIFNDPRTDRVESWDIINLQVTLSGPEDRWFVRGFVQNLENDNNQTGAFVTDPATGLFTNIFLIEPRRYGVMAGYNF